MNPNPFPTQPPPLTPEPFGGQPPRLASGPFQTLMRAIFGPFMLLVVGALFALDYAGGPNVGQTWPALIIAAGLLKLGEFMGARNI